MVQKGCRRVCYFPSWIQKCCGNHYGRDCQVCPGGIESPCNNHGNCSDGILGSGKCTCNKGFKGSACDQCSAGYYGTNCTACDNCGKWGNCDDGIQGSGKCVCRQGWTGENCQLEIPPELCSEYNGGCHQNADCNQTGWTVNCTCQFGFQGDGFFCEPINRCIQEQNGGCSDFASCKFVGPNKRDCECLPGYVGNGVQCLEKVVPPVDRCLQDNGDCDPVATCKDLHYHAKTAGVFHLRSPSGKYKMNFSEADTACTNEGATLASFKQLGDAQQLGMHLCVAGWMDGGKVGYPICFPSLNCGENHVGLVMYRDPVPQSSKYDAYCYRLDDVSCVCPAGFVGDGYFCNGVLMNVLATNSNFSIFYQSLLDYSGSSSEGKELIDFLSHRTSEVTIFVPPNTGFAPNQTLSGRDLEYHISASQNRRTFKDLQNHHVIPTRLGYNLTISLGHNETHKMVNERLVLDWDIPASNGIIHIIEAPLMAPPVRVTISIFLLLMCILAGVGFSIFRRKTDAFRFHYFKVRERERETKLLPQIDCSHISTS
uniref:Stabilin 2 n=1 Tax=Takifugu rubripes TaxID=31033 RepID=H2TN10_TAKRU